MSTSCCTPFAGTHPVMLGTAGGWRPWSTVGTPQVLASVIRISTHARIYAQPSTLDEAIKFCRILLAADTCMVVRPSDRHWDIFVDVCAKSGATGNLIQDAWFAALAIESGCEWVTTDRDYSRFPGLRWRTPF